MQNLKVGKLSPLDNAEFALQLKDQHEKVFVKGATKGVEFIKLPNLQLFGMSILKNKLPDVEKLCRICERYKRELSIWSFGSAICCNLLKRLQETQENTVGCEMLLSNFKKR